MEPGIEARLKEASREQMVRLFRELSVRHPELLIEMVDLLVDVVEKEKESLVQGSWNDESNEVVILPSARHPVAPLMDLDGYKQRIEQYAERLRRRESAAVIGSDLENLLVEAEQRTLHYDYYNALGIYAIVLDERLAERSAALNRLLDRSIDEVIPNLATLLSEASSSLGYESNVAPLLSKDERQLWLMRLFKLWLMRLDNRVVEEDISDIILDMLWREDVPILEKAILDALAGLRKERTSIIVDLNQQYRLRTLERFLKEIPPV
ncbi:hypothetical protein [Ktedonospora formicarum]|uniref:Uncharacterized protein n=1 Tax=Ktedonospora formicarum TaxID=2778364 RepID=A0A8J3I1D6_9CHLR|nr:hypothetical protein [Ktedonospora formicarum]GHO44283.1 hypothetical protein KSX_24460 [Ktedonospora formicarum]